MAARVALLKKFEAEFDQQPAGADRDLRQLHSRRAARSGSDSQLEKESGFVSSGISNSAFTIMSRTFASPEARLKSLISREQRHAQSFDGRFAKISRFLAKIYTEIAIEQLPGIADFFGHDVPLAFEKATDPASSIPQDLTTR